MSKKLHEVLAVEGELQGVFKNIVAETTTSFEKKPHLYQGSIKTLTMVDDTRKHEEASGSQVVNVTDTVPAKLEYTWASVIRYLDCVLQKEEANQRAVADLVVEADGESVTLAAAVPATYLLGLETKLALLRPMLLAIPTLPPGGQWVPDEAQEKPGIYRRTQVDVSDKTEKTVKPITLAPATDKHPAQVQVLNVDVAIGHYATQYFHAGMTPHDKSVLLGRLDDLTRAVKQARQRANCTETRDLHIGKAVVDFLMRKS